MTGKRIHLPENIIQKKQKPCSQSSIASRKTNIVYKVNISNNSDQEGRLLRQ